MNPAMSRIAEWRAEPVAFVRQNLQAEPDEWQLEVLEALKKHQRICLKASKGPGKSTVLAWIGWWFLTVHAHPKVVATSITGENLKDNLWTEMAKWQARSELLKRAFTWRAERITANDHPETWWMSARTWPKEADKTQQANSLAGVHADHVLFLIDESGGIPDAVVATAEAGLANADSKKGTSALLVQAGNPTQTSGPLWRACTTERHLWFVKEISGDPDDPKRAPRVSIQWAREQIAKYGRDNPWVMINVFGKFPPGQSNTLIGADEASEASRRVPAESVFLEGVKVLGVDVARYGDDRTVLQCRQGPVAFQPKVFRNLDNMKVAGHVANLIRRWKPDGVLIDATGNGSGVVDRLLELHFDVIPVEAGSGAINADPAAPQCANLRAEMWWKMARWLKEGGAIPEDSELIAELTAPTYKFRSNGDMLLESKDDLKKRGLPSPDKADALAMTFAQPVQRRPRYELPGQSHHARARTDYDPFTRGQKSAHSGPYDSLSGGP